MPTPCRKWLLKTTVPNHVQRVVSMLKSLYSAQFPGAACSNIRYSRAGVGGIARAAFDEPSLPPQRSLSAPAALVLPLPLTADPFGLALLHSYPSFAVRQAKEGRLELSDLSESESPDFVLLSSSCDVQAAVGERISVSPAFAQIGVVEGAPVTFNFEAVDRLGNKAIEAGVVYYVISVDVASSSPFFSVARHRQQQAINVEKISSPAGSLYKAFFHNLEECTPVSFNFAISFTDGKIAEDRPAGAVWYAKEVTLSPTCTFKLALNPNGPPVCISDGAFKEAVGKHMARLHIVSKKMRALQLKGKNSIVRAASLRAAPALDSFQRTFGHLTVEYLRFVCQNVLDPDLLHALRSFASACKFFDVSSPDSRSELQSIMLQEARRHMKDVCKRSLDRDAGSLELVEYSAFRLLRLNVLIKKQHQAAKDKLAKSQLESVLNRIQAAWDVVNLYGTTVLMDKDGEACDDKPDGEACDNHSNHQNCTAFCVSEDNSVFALVRNGFFVLGFVEDGKCLSLDATGVLEEFKPQTGVSSESANCFCARPSVVDAKFVNNTLYLLILTMLTARDDSLNNVVARILEVKEFSKPDYSKPDSLMSGLQVKALESPQIIVGTYFPFCVCVPKFVKTKDLSKQLLVFAIERQFVGEKRVQVAQSVIRSVIPDKASIKVPFPSHDRKYGKIDWSKFEYLASVIVQRQAAARDLWVLCRVRIADQQRVKLWRFSLLEQQQQQQQVFYRVGEGLDIDPVPGETFSGPIDLWQICLTYRGLGVGVVSPGGHFYDVIYDEHEMKVVECQWTSFFFDSVARRHAKYVPWQVGSVGQPNFDELRKSVQRRCAEVKPSSTPQQRAELCDELILSMLSGNPHFVALNLCFDWEHPECDENSRITVPFSSATNVTQRLLLGTNGTEMCTPADTKADAEKKAASQAKAMEAQTKYLKAMQEYKKLMKEKH